MKGLYLPDTRLLVFALLHCLVLASFVLWGKSRQVASAPTAWSVLLQRPWVHMGLQTNGQAGPWPCLHVSQLMGLCSLGEPTCSPWSSGPSPMGRSISPWRGQHQKAEKEKPVLRPLGPCLSPWRHGLR